MPAMNCPSCGRDVGQEVFKTTKRPDGVTRRRRCAGSEGCGYTYTTTETISQAGLHVHKLDGRVVDFSRNSVRRAIRKAAVRPFAPERLDEIVEAVVMRAQRQAVGGVIDSQTVGDALLSELRRVDQGSHIRFALVHRGRRDRADGTAGWTDETQVTTWLEEEYPELEGYDPPTRLRSVVKRDGNRREPFNRKKLEQSIGYSSKGRGSRQDVHTLATIVADDVITALKDQPIVTSGQILRSLRRRDPVAYLRFASTAKRFDSPQDYHAEASALNHAAASPRHRDQ
jgi:transcriptional regulator NrdR family protein